MHAKYEVSTCNGSKDIAKVKVDNRQTNKQNRQDKNNMPPIIRSGGIKIEVLTETKNVALQKSKEGHKLSFSHVRISQISTS